MIFISEFDIIRAEIEALRDEIRYHNGLYYNNDAPEIEDDQYDKLTRRLKELETAHPELAEKDSPSAKIGGSAGEKFSPVRHAIRMESLQDVFLIDDVKSFCNLILKDYPDAEFVVEAKIDGLSVSLEYENGIFTRGSTRGDGDTGEDITENLLHVLGIPQKIENAPEFLEVRGEVFMPRAAFAELNLRQDEEGKKTFKNPRNAAAGSLRQKDASVTASRKLSCFVFNIQQCLGKDFSGHYESHKYLDSIGFNISPFYKMCRTVREVTGEIENIGEKRHDLEFDTDGAVVKVDSFTQRNSIGSTSKFPKWAAAFKYPPEEAHTVLRDIEITVGRTGVLTPTGVFDTVTLSGTAVSRASLHNIDYINSKNLKIGDTVALRKAGEIIPEVVSVVEHSPDGMPYSMPERCPSCGETAIRPEGEAAYRCENLSCPAQLFRRLVHFASRGAMDIEGLGPAVITLLLENNLISSPADIYRLDPGDIARLERMGDLSANNLISAISASKANELYRLIFALGIRHIGETASKLLAKKFGSIDNLMKASVEEIEDIEGFGEIMALAAVGFFENAGNQKLIEELKELGVDPVFEIKERDSQIFSGMTFVLTGTLSMPRSEAEKLIEDRGGKCSGSVSRKTSCVLAGESAGSKLEKARTLNVNVISEQDFLDLLEN